MADAVFDVSLNLNFGETLGHVCNVRVLVATNWPEDDDGSVFDRAEQAAKDALRPFLKSEVHFGELGPMPVAVSASNNRSLTSTRGA